MRDFRTMKDNFDLSQTHKQLTDSVTDAKEMYFKRGDVHVICPNLRRYLCNLLKKKSI